MIDGFVRIAAITPDLRVADCTGNAAETVRAARAAYAAYAQYEAEIRAKGQEIIDYARANGYKILVMAGRPYHIDPEINHGIDELATTYGFCLITEDAVAYRMDKALIHES